MEGVACVAVFVREEERERKGERRWAFVPGNCFGEDCWRLCPIESTENGCATTAVLLAAALSPRVG